MYLSPFRCVPTTVDSWRGVYAEPALGWSPAGYTKHVDTYPTVASLIAELEQAISGRIYTGWKGGEFTYDGTETLHVDNPGDYTMMSITGVDVKDYEVVICVEPEAE